METNAKSHSYFISEPFRKNFYEKQAWENNHYIVGIDEVGRGCSAGPVVAAAAILPCKARYHLLKDSKKLTKEQLNTAYNWLLQNCWYATGICSHDVIDSINIYEATKRAMKRAVIQLLSLSRLQPEKIVVDAARLQIETCALDVYAFTKGEDRSISIAAASIIAKVTRDRIMTEHHRCFPAYGFNRHKGYTTSIHQKNILESGASLIHRKTFVATIQKRQEDDGQTSLFC